MFNKKVGTTRALVIIGIVAVLIAVIITAGVLLGIFLQTEAQLEVMKFTKKRDENHYQDVDDDPNINIVQYYVHDGDQDAWIVNDFNQRTASHSLEDIIVKYRMQKYEGQSEVNHQREKTTDSRSAPYVFTSVERLPEENTMFSKKLCTTKALVIIGIVAVLIAVIITAGVLLGIFLQTESQLKIIKFTKQRDEDHYQDVHDDPNTNIVQYHVHDGDQDSWIVNDFNRDIQTMKVQTKEHTNCYMTALNRSIALTPSEITGPESYSLNQTVTLMYRKTNSPVADTSFLHETAQKLCKGVSVYWLYPQCGSGSDSQQSAAQSHRSRRQSDDEDNFMYIDKYPIQIRACWFICLCLIC